MFTPLEEEDEGSSASSTPHISQPWHSQCLARLNLPRETFALINATFVAVATILGTGILALPVKLSHSGFGPFFFTFTICLCMQLATVVLMVELLQRTHAEIGVRQDGTDGSSSSRAPSISIEFVERTASGTLQSEDTTTTSISDDSPDLVVSSQQASIFTQFSANMETLGTSTTEKGDHHHHPTNALALTAQTLPDLHRMGSFFLHQHWLRLIFDASVVLHFCAAMISYNLAGPEGKFQFRNTIYTV